MSFYHLQLLRNGVMTDPEDFTFNWLWQGRMDFLLYYIYTVAINFQSSMVFVWHQFVKLCTKELMA